MKLPKRRHRTEKTISIQSTSFFTVVFACLAKALPVYRRNPIRPPVALHENIESSAAIVLMVTGLESHVNRLMYFEPHGLSTKDNLLKKLETYLPQRKYKKLLRQMEEVTTCRDAIVHAHVWEETRKLDVNWNIVKQSWKVAHVTQLRGKIKRNIMKRAQVSRLLRVNLMPTKVNYADAVKALVVILRLMRELEKRYGNPKAWVGPFPYEPALARVFLAVPHEDDWEDWISGTLRRLHPSDLTDAANRLKLRMTKYNNNLAFAGLVPSEY
jgi:hypothetical protein